METPILDKLEEERVFSATLDEDNTRLEIYEQCDGYFYSSLTKDHVQQLIKELQYLEAQMK